MRRNRNIREIPKMNVSEFLPSRSKLDHKSISLDSVKDNSHENIEIQEKKTLEESMTTGIMTSGRTRYRASSLRKDTKRENPWRNSLPVVQNNRNARSRKGNDLEDNEETFKLLKKVGISAAICLAVILFKSIDTPITKDITEGIKSAITSQLDIDKTLGKLKFVKNYIPDVASVFKEEESNPPEQTGGQMKLIAPMEGKIVRKFGRSIDAVTKKEVLSTGIDIEGAKGASIYAAGDGEVVEVSENENLGKYIRIKHGEQYETIYGNCAQIFVKAGSKVKQKDMIGKITNLSSSSNYLHFETIVHGKPIDPLQEIDDKNKTSPKEGSD